MFRFMRVPAVAAAAALVCFAAAAAEDAPSNEMALICDDEVNCRLDQGWDKPIRQEWYTKSQGSRLVPLHWILALEKPDSTEPFFSDSSIESYGFLLNPGSTHDPKLPLGFAVDEETTESAKIMCGIFPETCAAGTMQKPWLGVNCAACHTGEISYQGKRLRIEGGATIADLQLFLEDLLDAMQDTKEDQQKLQRFIANVLARDGGGNAESLKNQFNEQLAWHERLEKRNLSHLQRPESRHLQPPDDTDHRYGPARFDAFGHIFSKVVLLSGATDQSIAPKFQVLADAPASYPFIWNTGQQASIQWNGVAFTAPEEDRKVVARIRNTSQVIGAFAHVEFNDNGDSADPRDALYRSSMRIDKVDLFENMLDTLYSPVWPDELLGEIDEIKAARGELLYHEKCEGCHALLAPQDLSSEAREQMHPAARIETDMSLACNAVLHQSRTGYFQGLRDQQGGIKAFDSTLRYLRIAAAGAANFARKAAGQAPELTDIEMPAPARIMPRGDEYSPVDIPAVLMRRKAVQLEACRNGFIAGTPPEPNKPLPKYLLAYKARPLNGIWATAPYLHNGSVPTLYDLLLPPKLLTASLQDADPAALTRPRSFGVGGREFDPEKVGYAAEQEHPFTFHTHDTSGEPIPGNDNAGHEYGTDLSDDERWDLIEYLKTL